MINRDWIQEEREMPETGGIGTETGQPEMVRRLEAQRTIIETGHFE